MSQKKGFTLIELIIVIALIAILATTVILVINPVKIFQEARDSQRIADLGQMNSALSLLVSSYSSASLGTSGNCYMKDYGAMSLKCNARYTMASATSVTSTSQAVSGSGWVPVDLTQTTSGASIAAWPIDPKGATTTGLFYSYVPTSSSTWEFAARMESSRYKQGGSEDVESTDGGNVSTLFEVGSGVTDVN